MHDKGICKPLPFSVGIFVDHSIVQPYTGSCVHDSQLTQVFYGQLMPTHAPIRTLADSGATHAFCNMAFAHKHKLRVKPLSKHMQSVRLADSTTCLGILGCTRLHLRLADAQICIDALVLPGNASNFDVILRDSVFRKYKAALVYEAKVLELNVNGLEHIVPSASYPSYDRASVVENSNAFAHASQFVIGSEEANACIKEGAEVNLLWIRPEFVSSEQQMNSATVQSVPQTEASDIILQSEMQEIVDKYKSVFSEVPSGLPPDLDRGVGHTIPLEKDAKPPFRNIYVDIAMRYTA